MTANSPQPENAPPLPRIGLRLYLLAVLAALVGGLLGIPGAFIAELQVSSLSLLFLAPPIAEELLKPIGLYFFLFRWPHVLRKQIVIACLAALSGLVFGLLESTIYATVYIDNPSTSFLIFRFTVPVLLHVCASFTAGLGINQQLIAWVRGQGRFPRASREAFALAMALHLAYNVTVIALGAVGLLDFD